MLCAFACVVAVGSHAETALNVKTSWIGNTFGFGDGAWTQINISAIAVTPDGKVYTNTPWDESGAEISVYQNGKMLGFAGGTHGWGNSGGNAIALNHKYLYAAVAVDNEGGHLVGQGIWPPKGQQWFGVSRRTIGDIKNVAAFQAAARPLDPHAQLATGFLKINEVDTENKRAKASASDANIGGLAANDTTLYASDTSNDRILSYTADSMQSKASWTVREPGRIALAPDNSLWVLSDTRTAKAPKLLHLGASGQQLDDAPALPPETVAVDVAVDAQGRVLIADNGPRQQVLFFTKSGARYAMSGMLGERGGIFSGVAGKPGPQRFNGLTSVGVDAKGNVYVGCNGTGPNYEPLGAGLGATLESYASDGKQQWQVQGLLFVDGAWIDPARPDSVYTGNKRFELDLSKPAGQDWKYVGFLSNRFKYPEDPVFHTDQWPGLPIARSLKGHTILYLTDMYADHLKIYRFNAARDGEVAIPSGFMADRGRPVENIPNAPPGGDWIWRDSNGNGRFDANEFTTNTTGTKLAGGWGWWVDTNGDIWRARDDKGIFRFRFGGLDAQGNPIYSYSNLTAYPVPQPFTELHRAIYEPDTDSMYATGYTPQLPGDKNFWKEAGRLLVRYDKWGTGKPVQRYAITLPWEPNARPVRTAIGLTVEGQYIFVVEPVGAVHVYDKDTGKEIGVMRPGPEVGSTSGWVDVPNGVSAARRKDGEYLVFVEEDARGKVTMYRWKP
ncbi:hypothetical protein [Paraburkholderia sp.]|uniref:hypothetical protein n=1 Tax=Paraburkholderia sp. TaxID=1926495 RepID=UPI00239F5D21|nr:hypothetical protein [Paraburkholderia sp.]MDE1184313.1 hypothetical protein [Paraburkholderia sp.]